MKKFILPVVLAILLPVLVRVVNPEIEPVGIILVGAIGVAIGSGINKLIFKGKGSSKKKETV